MQSRLVCTPYKTTQKHQTHFGSQVLETEADYQKIAASKEIPDYQELDFIKQELALQKSDHLRRMVGITAGIIMVFLLLGGVATAAIARGDDGGRSDACDAGVLMARETRWR